MGRRSIVHVEVGRTGSAITAVRVAGACVEVGRGYLEV